LLLAQARSNPSTKAKAERQKQSVVAKFAICGFSKMASFRRMAPQERLAFSRVAFAGFIVIGLAIDLYGNGLKLLICVTGAGFVALGLTFFRGIPRLGARN
jgi:hypothetical protein